MLTMYDGITKDVPLLPADGDIYAGYDDGSFNDVAAIVARFPGKPVLSIDVTGAGQAQCLDVENGDAAVTQIDPWLAVRALTGPVFDRPVVYMSLNTAKTAFPVSHPNGCLLWTAHYTNAAHICGPGCGLPYDADMTQWESVTDYDRSLVNPAHFIFRKVTPVATTTILGTPVKGQDQWGACRKCSALVYVNYGGNVCPAGGEHDVTGSDDYTLMHA